MRRVFLISDSMLTPLGLGSAVNYDRMIKGQSGIKLLRNALSEKPFHASMLEEIDASHGLTRFENIAAVCAADALKDIQLDRRRTIMILSTTKGNVSHLGESNTRISLHESAAQLAKTLSFEHFTTVSNACISGVMAILLAKRLLSSGKFDHALVVGAEELSQFIVSGFQSLFAISETPCRPFDKDRSGITLGEAGGAILISVNRYLFGDAGNVEILGGAMSNDANHISGPSRTGLELASAIEKSLSESKLTAKEIDIISAHGTATLYNDEMEAKAFDLAGLSQTPLNSLKAYFGHTLGAAGVIETIIMAHGMMKNEIMPTLGFHSLGVSKEMNVSNQVQHKSQRFALKTASGFGGCNAAMVLEKIIS